MNQTVENLATISEPFRLIQDDGHEQLVHCYDESTGLKALIAIHNTVLGPALGGTRFWKYNNESEALRDVLRLSRGMTYKSAISGLNLGGGKAVIIGDPLKIKNEALMRRFGKFVDSLNGKYITAEDVGVDTKDMEFIRMETKHVTGLPEWMGGGGNPSPVTAYGVYMGMKACAKIAFGSDSLANKKIGVQGIGHVGESVVQFLVKEGAKVFITDINSNRMKEVAKNYAVNGIEKSEDFFTNAMDIYAPCALGATLNTSTISQLNCAIVAGAANNQLENEDIHGEQLVNKGLIYAPDFVINAGGIINVYSELHGYNREMALAQAEKIYHTVFEIVTKAKEENLPAQKVAMRLAQERIEKIARINQVK